MIVDRAPCTFIFTFGRGNDGLDAGRQATVKIARFKTWRNLFINDALAERVRQNPLQPITRLQKHSVILDKDKEHRAVVFILVANSPGPEDADAIIIHRGIGLHLRKNGDDDLLGSLALKIFQRLVQLRNRGGRNHIGVVVEISRGRRRNDLIREQSAA